MTDNETAKLHLRHMVGGRLSDDIADEMVFRVEFPERPEVCPIPQRWVTNRYLFISLP